MYTKSRCFQNHNPFRRQQRVSGLRICSPQGAFHCSSLRYPVSDLFNTVLTTLKKDAGVGALSSKRITIRPPSAHSNGVTVRLVAVDSNGKMTKERLLLDSQQALDRVLKLHHSPGLISLNGHAQPSPSANLEDLQSDCEYIFQGDHETLDSLRRLSQDSNSSDTESDVSQSPYSSRNGSAMGEMEQLVARLVAMYPTAIPRPDLCHVAPAPNEPRHEAPLAGQSYGFALEVLPEDSVDPLGSMSSGYANGSSASVPSSGATAGAGAANGVSPSSGSSNGKVKPTQRSSLILGQYVAWLDGDHVDEAHKRVVALRRRAAQPSEWPSYSKFSEFERISLVMFGHKIAEGEEDRVECLSGLYGIRLVLAENALDVCPPTFLKT